MISITKMIRQGRITRSTINKEIAEQLREQMIFREAMAQIHNDTVLAAIRSYILGMFADDE